MTDFDEHSSAPGAAPEPAAEDAIQPPAPLRVPRPWRPGAALALAVSVLGINSVASLGVRRILDLELADTLTALLVAACFAVAYAIPLGVVWLVSVSQGIGFADFVALRRPRAVSTREWLASAVTGAVVARAFALAFGVVVTLLSLKLPGMDADPLSLFPGGLTSDLVLVAVVVLLAPFAEEVVFRGVLLSSLGARWGTVTAVIASSLVFASVHVNAFLLLPILIASLFFGLLYVRFESLWPAVLCHAVFNGVAVVLAIALRGTGVL